MEKSEILKRLNDEQRQVVTTTSGPILVLAGAGSGKTRVLTHRIAYLVAGGISTDRILAVTFTNKAARQMKERISRLLSLDCDLPWITTFHSACLRILRRQAHHIGYDTHFTIYDEADQVSVMKGVLKHLGVTDKAVTPQAALYFIERAKNRLISPERFENEASDPFLSKIARVYRRYQGDLVKNGAMDFADLIMQTVRLFEEAPQVLAGYQERFIHVLVDEYQDTNTAQYRLIRQLTRQRGNLCVVGDDDQSIYRWRGADLGNILEFERDFPDTTVVVLGKNYRSSKNILAAAGSVVRNNVGRKEKRLWTDNDQGEKLIFFEAGDEHEEARYVIRSMKDLMARHDYRPADFAIFFRTNAQSRIFEDELIRQSVGYQIIGGMRFYDRMEIKDVLAYLRAAVMPNDSVSLLRIINTPVRGIGDRTIEAIRDLASRRDVDLLRAAALLVEEGSATPKAAKGIASVMDILSAIGREEGIVGAARRAVIDSGLLSSWQSMRTEEAQGRVENLEEFLSAVAEFERANPNGGITDFLDQVALVSDLDAMDDASATVSLLTLHSAKGLEFPVVFMVGMEEGLFPHQRSMDAAEDIEEERRLCYVGMTRAKERLFLTSARNRTVFGQGRICAPSRFVGEIDSAYIITEKKLVHVDTGHRLDRTYAQRGPELDDYFSDGDSPFRPGVRIRHPEFGIGVIKGVEESGGRYKLSVLFSGVGMKKVITGYVPIEIV
jgi:DNA helicase II / ATP-dependent DNA helicase PcrA